MGRLPERVKLNDFSGAPFTLNPGASAWKELSPGGGDKDLVLLGAAPGNLESLPFAASALARNKKIYWLEAPETLAQLRKNGLCLPPKNKPWIPLHKEALAEPDFDGQIFFYEPGLRLAPDFWGPIIASLNIKKFSCHSRAAASALAWLPGNSGQLLHKELQSALAANGFGQIISELPDSPDPSSLEKIWRNKTPQFILSVNFRGLDSEGKIFEICQALNIPLAVWLVDNPWHLLSGIRYPWWKRANLFVSDGSFAADLRSEGAACAAHCPLAAAEHMWRKPPLKLNDRPLFIGRSIFPKQKEFFGNMRPDRKLEEEAALYLMSRRRYPDYHWWQKKFNEAPWPGKGGRKAGFYADYYSARNRAEWLKKAFETKIRIIGDEGWKNIIPEGLVESPVDYYGKLPEIYNESPAVLNITSLLLPGSLNQRHFDVWAAGSFLITDVTNGLDIFPSELADPIKAAQPEEFPIKFSFWQSHQSQRRDFIHSWQEHLKSSHTYVHRVEFIMEACRQRGAVQIL